MRETGSESYCGRGESGGGYMAFGINLVQNGNWWANICRKNLKLLALWEALERLSTSPWLDITVSINVNVKLLLLCTIQSNPDKDLDIFRCLVWFCEIASLSSAQPKLDKMTKTQRNEIQLLTRGKDGGKGLDWWKEQKGKVNSRLVNM